jgi:glycosyltransferase involved in cell wall biosynthesis
MKRAELPGVLRGEALAEAYANMDLFLFPSWTDTFGNVILEALSCGVPCIVTSGGGPKYLIEQEVSGIVAQNDAKFTGAALSVVRNPDCLKRLREGALSSSFVQTWDDVFEQLYRHYSECRDLAAPRRTLSPSPAV